MKITTTDKKVKVRCENMTYTIVLPKQNKDNVVERTISHALKTVNKLVKKAKQHEAVKQIQDRTSTIYQANIPPAPEPMFVVDAQMSNNIRQCVICGLYFKPEMSSQKYCMTCDLPKELRPTAEKIFWAKSILDLAYPKQEKKKQTDKDK
jgi:hypothetical protein